MRVRWQKRIKKVMKDEDVDKEEHEYKCCKNGNCREKGNETEQIRQCRATTIQFLTTKLE